ncbi:hypothetical protein ASC77_22595 [Nocardioides sp. Root1257]|uniref:M48 family metalloprotease n=1 Tax=unclassified Nocardioides TaxID=2615069 RepID=UPI0006F643CE|nr:MULTISPECIES: M48 family metallopeptidase [unclassified Nocardioides]KQW43079.1 hypothetical protein ASC77_22595 [Nocardioides sp. Root1257]KRC41947.1 hypothetical protein ASE24_22385 [Nocardioides sp. Root224]
MDGPSLRERIDGQDATSIGRPRPAARVAAFVLATVIHLVTLAIAVLGGWLVELGDNWVQRTLGIVVLLPVLALVLPRRGHESHELVQPDTAPEFMSLLRELSDSLGTPAPTYVALDASINAYAANRGLRQRELVIGAPLWVALGPQARIALLGHELAHFAGRDVVHGRYVWWADRTLRCWLDLATPDGLVSTEGRLPLFATIATAPLRLPLVGYVRLMEIVHAAASRRDELRADTAGSVLAGTAGGIEMLETLLLGDVIDVAANRAAVDPGRPDLAVEIRERVLAVSESARRALPAQADGSRVDATHPSTADRLRLQESLPVRAPSVTLDQGRWATIDEELRPARDAALRRRADHYRYAW